MAEKNINQVRAYTMSDAALEVFTKLFNKGPQTDGDLPSKAGMKELISLNLAKKDPKDAERNLLTKLGAHEAAVYFTEQAVRKQQEESKATEEHPVAEEEAFHDGEPLDETEPA
jgi:hypothetical protein